MTIYPFHHQKTLLMTIRATLCLLLILPFSVLAGSFSGTSALDSNSSSFNRPEAGEPCGNDSGINTRYDELEFSVDTAGSYTLNTSVTGASGPAGSDPFLVIYKGSSCLGANDDAVTLQSQLSITLSANTTYRMVITTYEANVNGTAAWRLNGPGIIQIVEKENSTATASVWTGRNIALSTASGTSTTFVSSDESVATVNNTGVVSGLKAGTATIIATEESGTTVTTTVTVIPRARTNLGASSFSGADTDAFISAGVTNDGGATSTNNGTFSATDTVSVYAAIHVDSNDVGSAGEIIALVSVVEIPGYTWPIIDSKGSIGAPLSIDFSSSDFSSVPAAKNVSSLAASETLNILSEMNFGDLGLAGLSYKIYVGYRNQSKELFFNKTPITFTIAAQ